MHGILVSVVEMLWLISFFGDVSPSGKLPITFPKSIDQLPDYGDYSMIGRTYKYMEEETMYPFGFGLGYENLEWEEPIVNSNNLRKGQNLKISINLINDKEMDLDEVVQVYMTLDNEKEKLPLASLIDFKRISVNKGGQKKILFEIPYESFSYYDDQGNKKQHKGETVIILSNASPGERSKDLGSKSFRIKVRVK